VSFSRLNRIPVYNTLLAAVGGVVLTMDVVFAWSMDKVWVNGSLLATLLVLFWLSNLIIILAVATGRTAHLKDPSFSVPMMYWASFSCFGALLIVQNYREMIYCSLFTVVVFGVFRLTPPDFRRYALFVISLQMMHSIVSSGLGISAYTWLESGAIWIALLCTILIMDGLCISMSLLRQRLRKKNKELEAAIVSKEQFLANMSHELRTPMNGILGMLDMLDTTHLSAYQTKYLDIARSSGATMLVLINDILDLSKINGGRLVLETRPFQFVVALQNLTSGFHYLAQNKNINLDVILDSNLPTWIMGDEVRVLQIFSNLISNAIKFTQQGKVSVEVHCDYDGDQCHIFSTINDTGIGIEAEAIERIFEQFSQADETTTRRYGGTGLGLSIAKKLCQVMGGDIQLQSQPGKGSSFSLDFYTTRTTSLQSAPNDDSHPVSSESSRNQISEADLSTIQNRNVLVVEDNQVNQQVARAMLSKLGVNVVIAENGEEALDCLKHTGIQFELILMDCQLPVLDGYAATRAIRNGEAGEKIKAIPIVALTANAFPDDQKKCFDAGMDDYLSKPISFKQLRIKLIEWIQSDSKSE